MNDDYPPPHFTHMVRFPEPVDPLMKFVDLRGSYDLRTPPIGAFRIRGYPGTHGSIACLGSGIHKSTLQALFSFPMHAETLEAIGRAFMDLAAIARRCPVSEAQDRFGSAAGGE